MSEEEVEVHSQYSDDRLDRIIALLERIAREQKTVRELTSKFVYAMIENAEQEVPEFMRRFANYMHDLHDIRYMYEELGHAPPVHILREMERCDDRYRQLLTKLHTDGGAFEKVRREMAADPENRWDHTRFLPTQEKTDETRKGE
jgi:hypothetical protein